MARGRIWKAIAALALGTALFGIAQADTTPPPRPPITIHGIVTTANGKPAPDVVLYLRDLPGGYSTPPISAEETRVVTDAQGHFTWPVPTNLLWSVGTPLSYETPNEMQSEPAVTAYWLPTGPGWTVTPSVRPVSPWETAQMQGSDISQLFEQATVRCTSHYLTAGNTPEMSVILPKDSPGTIALRLRGPDGRLIPHHLVQIRTAPNRLDFNGVLLYSSKTGANGQANLPWQPGLCHLQVTVPGVGFGDTGTFALQSGQTVTPQIPLLAAWATVSGQVAPSLVKPSETVQVQTWDASQPWAEPSASVDAQGRFTILDVFPGDYHLELHHDTDSNPQTGAAHSDPFTVKSGQHLTGLTISPPAPLPPSSLPVSVPTANALKPTQLTGHVLTADGKPVAGASVWAVYSVSNSNGVPTVSVTTTDASGAYSFSGLRPEIYGASLYAVGAGHPLATAMTQSVGPRAAFWGTEPAKLTGDLILSDAHTGLVVHVLQNGKPAGAGVTVTVSADDANSGSEIGFMRADPEATNTLGQALRPNSVTDATGTAYFKDLSPGMWTVSGSAQSPSKMAFEAQGVPITIGTPTGITVNLLPPAPSPTFRPLEPDGTAPTGTQADYQESKGATPINGYSGGGSQLAADGTISLFANFFGERGFGLYQVRPILHDTPTTGFNSTTEPYDAATGLLAVSPALPAGPPLVLHTAHFGPGSVSVHLVGIDGRPAHGTVRIGERFHEHQDAASTDAHGNVTFTDLPSGDYTAQASLTGPPAAPLGQNNAPFPSNDALRHVDGFAPQTVTVTANHTTTVTITAQHMGYVRGRMIGPPDVVSHCNLYPYLTGDYNGPDTPSLVRYDKNTGEYLVGPLLPGKIELNTERYVPGNNSHSTGEITVTIPSTGGVLHQDLTPPPPPSKSPYLGPQYPLTSTVYLSDGTTPAWNAHAVVLLPDRTDPANQAQADAHGQLAPSGFGAIYPFPFEATPSGVTRPTLVAWLPGSTGATLIPYDPAAPVAKIVLPAPCAITGRVTVAGRSTAKLPSTFEVEAHPTGQSQLAEILTVTVTAQADGTFTLPGLSAGTYQVQAARDNLWLSAAQTVTLPASGTPPPPITLDIPAPGQTVTLHLTDTQGRPLPLFTLTLPQPPGPLTDRLWPSSVTTDGAGDLTLPGLTAGRHTLEVPSQTQPDHKTLLPFSVPPLVSPIPPVQTLTVPATVAPTAETDAGQSSSQASKTIHIRT